MIEKLEKRKERERQSISQDSKISDKDLFRQMGNKVKVIKK